MNIFKKKEDDLLAHNIAVAANFEFLPNEFYDRVEAELEARKIPGIAISRVEYAEGGLLSHKRTYLRVIRERLAFDTCAAPFGTEFFFSYRSVYSPPRVQLWHLLVVLVTFYLIFVALIRPLGFFFASLAVLSLVFATIQVFQNAVAASLGDLDSLLLKIPGFGPIYEAWFRKDTYYRQDTRLIYLEIIPRLVQMIMDEITAKDGVKLMNQYERAPILGDLYKPKRKPTTE
jgi:hypothetical protein